VFVFQEGRWGKTARRGKDVAVRHWINFLERSDQMDGLGGGEDEDDKERKVVLRGRYKRKKDE
jgi:hypothetical protein